jgi:hypothetical protein
MCCGMSCVGGLGFWYMQDPTLGGILGPAASSAVSTPSDSTVTSTSTADPPAASVPTDKDVYIWHKGCAAASTSNGKRFTLLSGNTSIAKFQVGLGCKSAGKEDSGWSTMWRFEKAGSNLYFVKHKKSGLFLTADSPFRLAGKTDDDKWRQQWYVGKGSDGGVTLTLSRSAVGAAINAGKAPEDQKNWRYMAWNETFCNGDPGSHNRQANDPWMNGTTDAKQTLWGIKVPGDATKMKNTC